MSLAIDTHAHLTDSSLDGDLDQFLQQAAEAGVAAILTVGTTLADSRRSVEIANSQSSVRAAVGIHPNTCCTAEATDWSEIEILCKEPRVAALGETGLDRYWDDCPWECQVDYLRRHIALSRETGLPIVIHTRDCAEETLEILQSEHSSGEFTGVMHSFTGPVEVAHGCLDLGLYISFAGMVTYKNAPEIQAIAKDIPSDRILVETDSPYLTPHPHRGKRPNHPANVMHTLEFVAKLRETAVEDFDRQTTENAIRLFGAW